MHAAIRPGFLSTPMIQVLRAAALDIFVASTTYDVMLAVNKHFFFIFRNV